MSEYHKIQTVYLRDPATDMRTLLDGQFALPEFDYLQGLEWIGTEKIDGTNIRVNWDGSQVIFGGKTDNAQTPTFLLQKLQQLFTTEKMSQCFVGGGFCLYGEGYGAKIQSGGGYIPNDCSFILFDVSYNGMWLERANVIDIATKLFIDFVPQVFTGTLKQAVDFVKNGFQSTIGQRPAEGLVLRPQVELLNRRGDRIITKIKCKDFRPYKVAKPTLAPNPKRDTEGE